MFRSLRTVALICLLVLPAAAGIQTLPAAHAQTQGETEQEIQQYLSAGYYNYTKITVQSPAIIGYATKSNVTIDTAFMTTDQLEALSQPGASIANSIFYEAGQENYDALLEVPGTYYLVVYSPSAPANVTGIYIVNYNIDLRNSSTSVALTITIQPGPFSASRCTSRLWARRRRSISWARRARPSSTGWRTGSTQFAGLRVPGRHDH